MLSRASLLSGQFGNRFSPNLVRLVTSSASNNSAVTSAGSGVRDEVNFPRPVRAEHSAPVRLGFIPESWFQLFYKKTGVTGPYVFGVGLSTYLLSKEIYILEHEFYNGLSIALMVVIAMTKFGKSIGAYLDKEIDAFDRECNEGRQKALEDLKSAIVDEEAEQKTAEGQTLLVQAKKELVDLQIEAAYRERLAQVFNEVKKRLEYQAAKQSVLDSISHKHMVNWIVNNVLKSLTPDQEKATLNQCIADLDALSKNYKP